MKKVGLIFILIILQLSVYASDYFEFKYTKVGSVQIFRNGLKLDVSKIEYIAEPSKGHEVDLDNDGIPEIKITFIDLGGSSGTESKFLKYEPKTNTIKEIVSNVDLHNVKFINSYIISSYSDVGFWYEAVSIYDTKSNKINLLYKDQNGYTDLGLLRHKGNFTQIVDKNKNILERQPLILPLTSKSILYKNPSESSQSKMYLIAGDKVTLLDNKTDESGKNGTTSATKGKKR
ncbi:MAG: hypothetical protein V2A75_05535 [Pseudomonadota bacterium]